MSIEHRQDKRRSSRRAACILLRNTFAAAKTASFVYLLIYAHHAFERAIGDMPFSLQVSLVLLAGYTLPVVIIAAVVVYDAICRAPLRPHWNECTASAMFPGSGMPEHVVGRGGASL